MKREKALFRKIFVRHRQILKNFSVKNKERIVIGIAGIPGSGKTLLARFLAGHYKALRISNDEVRRIIGRLNLKNYGYSDTEGQKLIYEYLLYCLTKLSKISKNGFFVLDSGIERKYDEVNKWCKKNKYKLFIIQISISHRRLLYNLHRRRKAAERYLPHLPRWTREYRFFIKRGKTDLVFRNNGKTSDIQIFLKKLSLFLKEK